MPMNLRMTSEIKLLDKFAKLNKQKFNQEEEY